MKTSQKLILGGLIVLILVTSSSIVYTFVQQRNEERVAQSMAEVAALPDRAIVNDSSSDPSDFASTEPMEFPIEDEPVTTTQQPVDEQPSQQPAQEPSPQIVESTPVQETPAPDPNRTIKSGSFESVGNYQTSGGVSFELKNGDYTLDFGNDFSFSGAPDPVVYLCPEKSPSSVSGCQILGALQSNSGFQSWQISQEEAEQYNNVIVWCRAFGVLMGTSSLN